MYADPRLIKKHTFKFKGDDSLREDVDLLKEFTGEQEAVILRELLMVGMEVFKKRDKAKVAGLSQ